MTSLSSNHRELRLQGIPASPGIAMGKIKVRLQGDDAPFAYDIEASDIVGELERFHIALAQTEDQLNELKTHMLEISGEKNAAIFDAHILLLKDKTMLNQVEKELKIRLQNVEHIFYIVMQSYMEMLRRVDDPYLRARTNDMEDVMKRVISNLTKAEALEEEEEEEIDGDQILISYDLTPSDTATMDVNQFLGFATEVGSTVSHTAILARSMGIPAVVAIDGALFKVTSHAFCILDGYQGLLILNPIPETIAYYQRLQIKKDEDYKQLEEMRDLPAVTQDGKRIVLSANVEFPYEYPSLKAVGAEGVGLFRTEFCLLGNPAGMPDEEEQTEFYTKLAQGCSPAPVIFRTLDSGGDKLPCEKLDSPEPNPFLGWRGIRVSLSRIPLFKDQLKAILRACAEYPGCGVMFPMVSGLIEIRQAKAILQECREELEQAGIPYAKDLKVGVMIEVPSAALMADAIAKEVDFFSIGTNDLTQYTIAVDRVNSRVAHMFRSTHPSVIRMIDMTIKAGQQEHITTSICGEMAGDVILLPLLIGLGADVVSVGVHLIPVIRYAIRHLDYQECRALADKALQSECSAEILELSTELAKKSYPKLFEV